MVVYWVKFTRQKDRMVICFDVLVVVVFTDGYRQIIPKQFLRRQKWLGFQMMTILLTVEICLNETHP